MPRDTGGGHFTSYLGESNSPLVILSDKNRLKDLSKFSKWSMLELLKLQSNCASDIIMTIQITTIMQMWVTYEWQAKDLSGFS